MEALPTITKAELARIASRFTSALVHGVEIDVWLCRRRDAWVLVTRQITVHDETVRKSPPTDGIYVGRFSRPFTQGDFVRELSSCVEIEPAPIIQRVQAWARSRRRRYRVNLALQLCLFE